QAAGQVSSGIDHDTSDANNRAHADQAAANAGNGAAQPAQAQQQNTGQGQQNQSDKPGFSITAGHGNLELTNTDTGHTVGDYGYVSGMNGDTNQADAGKGPIPSGKYTLDPKEISSHWWRKLFMSDWGDYRVPLHPEAGTDTHGRSGFFLHGGGVHWEETRYGSEGCIKVFDLNQNRLFQLLQGARGPVEVTVQ
ncbi:MAG: tlde1 domain-containing protein, partial [Terracidiphilus sp.]